MTSPTTRVELLAPARADDAGLVRRLTVLVNDVYAEAERGLWRAKATRTSDREVGEAIRSAEVAVAVRDGQIVGSVRLRDVDADATELGMLVAAPDERGSGVGRALVQFVERASRDRRRRAVRLELLVPSEWRHPSKEFLKAWYGRMGYVVVRTESLGARYPHLAPLLATECDLLIYEKALAGRRLG